MRLISRLRKLTGQDGKPHLGGQMHCDVKQGAMIMLKRDYEKHFSDSDEEYILIDLTPRDNPKVQGVWF